jgi:hypothetical protein
MDLSRLAQLLIVEFSPKYIKLSYDDMTKVDAFSPIATKIQLSEFLKNHLALKSPLQLYI